MITFFLMKVFPEGKLYEKKALCDLIFFRFSRFIHYVVSSYSYLCHVCRTDASCRPSPGKHAALVSFILSLRFVFSRSCLTLLDNTVICSQRGGSAASWVMCQWAVISFQRPELCFMLQIGSESQGLFFYPSTEVLIAFVKTHRLYLSVKSLTHPPKYSFYVIFFDLKKYMEMFSMLMWRIGSRPTLKTNHVICVCVSGSAVSDFLRPREL